MASTEGSTLAWSLRKDAPSADDSAPVNVAALVETYATLLFRVAHSVLRSRTEAEDVVQDVFLRVLEHRRLLLQVRDMRVWLIRIAWNLALDRKRRKRPDQLDDVFAQTLASATMPADTAMQEAQYFRCVLRGIEQLPKAERHVLLLSAIDEVGTAEIAAVLGRSESAVRAALTSQGATKETVRRRRAMKHADETIARMLRGLRSAEPSQGMQVRILHAMESRKIAPPKASWALRTAVAAGALVLALWIVTMTVRRHGTAPHPQTGRVAPLHQAQPAQALLAVRPVRVARRTLAHATSALSFPAPPLPLTHQERLLLQVAHEHDARNAAALNPAIHSAQMAKANQQFQLFFNIDDREMRRQNE